MKKWFFQILVLVNACFCSNSKWKSIEKLIFQLLARSWFWQMLFSIQILIKKILKYWFLQLLARSWFSRMIFLFKFSFIKCWKIDFSAFGKILVLVNTLFSIKILLKKEWKIWFFSAFGKILVLANVFFLLNSSLKRIENLIFSAFGKILGLANAFFLLKF